ncbi:MAG TPA: alkaline phosphatase family protein [Bryobacteraceae bacterium]|nr:alkaline phosphatase family protein [Bryobacteraceae bacterium]HPU71643.1 alkaline phosphatase family protein [Bryobacteraceae bacterium]
MHFFLFLLLSSVLAAADYAAPAGTRPALPRPGAESILPGGRLITPLGRSYATGPAPFGLAISPSGNLVVTANGGPRSSLTVLRRDKSYWWVKDAPVGEGEGDGWRSVFMGLAFESERSLFVSEGNSGRVRLIDPANHTTKHIYDLNVDGFQDSYTGDLALDRERGILYVLDQANFRMAAIDTRRHRVIASVRTGRLPFAIALSPDKRKAYITNLGMFQYQAVPGADPVQARETGLPFPAFGFPSPEASAGAKRETALGPVDVPGLGDPNAPESNSVAVVDLSDPKAPRLETFIRTGQPFGDGSLGGSSPSGIAAARDAVYVSNAHNDYVTVIDPRTNRVRAEIPIRIPGLENLRGVLPIGVEYVPQMNWVLVAEAGINAVGVIDARNLRVLGHVPVGWFPTRVLEDRGMVYVANAKGHGTGPSHPRPVPGDLSTGAFSRGSVTIFPLRDAGEFDKLTAQVLENNGFRPREKPPAALPQAIRHVVLIVKENRTFDEVFGDIETASNGPVNAEPTLARFGRYANVASERKGLRQRPIMMAVNITPNHHRMAERWAFSDNFYADSEGNGCGHHWLTGAYPNAWTVSSALAASGGQKDFRLSTAPGRLSFPQGSSSVHPEELPEAGAIWHHLERHGISFRSYGEGFELAGVDKGEGLKPTGARVLTNVPAPGPLYRNTSRDYPGFNMNIPDQFRASQFIAEIESKYVKGGEPLPRFIYIRLPQDHLAPARPEDGYPYQASYMADNDYALGRIVEYLSNTKWWPQMAIFVTEAGAQGWVDHVDSHRTLLLVASPYARRNYVSHVNSSFPGLLKTIFRLLGVPPLNLFDAAASDLSDCFTGEPDFTPYQAVPINPRLFDPAKVREPLDPER